MKRILMVIMLLSFMVPVIRAEESPEAKALKDEYNNARKELTKVKTATLKELKDDEKLKEFNAKMKEINEQRKAAEKELNDYLCEKKPEYADAQKKVDAVQEKINAIRKQKQPKKEGGKKKEKKKPAEE